MRLRWGLIIFAACAAWVPSAQATIRSLEATQEIAAPLQPAADPSALGIDSSGRFHVFDAGHREIVVFDAAGATLSRWAVPAPMNGSRPQVRFGPQGDTFILADARISRFQFDGQFLGYVAEQVPAPVTFAVSAGGALLVEGSDSVASFFRPDGTLSELCRYVSADAWRCETTEAA